MRWCVILCAVSAFGNECVELSQRDALKAATVVFSGRVERIEPITRHEDDPAAKVELERPMDGSPAVVTFSVMKSRQGSPDKRVKAFLFQKPPQGRGYRFQTGHDYVVYTQELKRWEPVLRISKRDLVYDLGSECPLRIRSDVAVEAARLGAR